MNHENINPNETYITIVYIWMANCLKKYNNNLCTAQDKQQR